MAVAPLPCPDPEADDSLATRPQQPEPGLRKRALEQLLLQRRLQSAPATLRGESRCLRPLATGAATIDALLGGGIPRGQLSELHGTTSSGRMSLLTGLLAKVTASGALAAFVDPADGFDPASAASCGVDLDRLLWLRGRGIAEDTSPKAVASATAAVATLAGSGLFDLVALDLVRSTRALRALPVATWLRLQRLVEGTPTALVLIAEGHVACSPGGASLALEPAAARWSGVPGPARLLRAFDIRARGGRHGLRSAEFGLPALT